MNGVRSAFARRRKQRCLKQRESCRIMQKVRRKLRSVAFIEFRIKVPGRERSAFDTDRLGTLADDALNGNIGIIQRANFSTRNEFSIRSGEQNKIRNMEVFADFFQGAGRKQRFSSRTAHSKIKNNWNFQLVCK